MNIHQTERIFFDHAITILYLFTNSVCDEKAKKILHTGISIFPEGNQSFLRTGQPADD